MIYIYIYTPQIPEVQKPVPCQGPSANQADQELNLPSLEGGKKASDVITVYMKGLLARSTKISDLLTKMNDIHPEKDRAAATQKSHVECSCSCNWDIYGICYKSMAATQAG